MPQKAKTVQLGKTSGLRSPYFHVFVSLYIENPGWFRKTNSKTIFLQKNSPKESFWGYFNF